MGSRKRGRPPTLDADGRRLSETTTKRRVVLYLPSLLFKEQLEAIASESGASSLSKFILRLLEARLTQSGPGKHTSQSAPEKEKAERILDLEQALTKARERVEYQSVVIQRKEEQIAELYESINRPKPATPADPVLGKRILTDLSKRGKVSYNVRLADSDLGMPASRTRKRFLEMMDALEKAGIVQRTQIGWEWVKPQSRPKARRRQPGRGRSE